MKFTIYIDVLFLLNLVIDYAVITSCSLISGRHAKKTRIITASIIGAAYSVMIFFIKFNNITLFITNLIIGIIINSVAFKRENLYSQLKLYIIYIIMNLIYGGGMYAFYHFTSIGSKMNYSNGVYYINLPLWAIIILSFLLFYLIRLFEKITEEKNNHENIITLEIQILNKKITVKSMIDTGNTLYDPLSLLPVMILESNELKDVIDLDIFNNDECPSNSLLILHKLYPELKLRIIPFKSVTGEKNVIFAFKPQKIFDLDNNHEINNTLVGIVKTKLSEDNSYQALLHSSK